MSTALDFAGHFAFDHVAFVDGFHDLLPSFDLLSLVLAEHDHAALLFANHRSARVVFRLFNQNANRVARFRQFLILTPLTAIHKTFALVTKVNDDEVLLDLDDLAFDDLVDGEFSAAPVHIVHAGIAERLVEFLFPVVLTKVQTTN